MVHEETCATSADSITGEKTIEQAIVVPLDPPTVQVIEWTLLDVVTPVEDFVLVEGASDDEEIVSQVTVDPILLITIEDAPMHSTVEVNAGASQPMEDPPMKATSSSSAIVRMEKDVACPPIHPSPPAMTTRR